MSRIAVIGIGNVLMGDDALGPWVVKALEARYAFPDDVQLVDAGTPGLDLTAWFAEKDAVIVVDVVKAKGAPGELRLYDREALMKKSPVLAMSPHDPGLREAILNADFMGVTPRHFKLVGVLPTACEYGLGLSDAVRAAIPAAMDAVLAELRPLGIVPPERSPPGEPDVWWEKKPGA